VETEVGGFDEVVAIEVDGHVRPLHLAAVHGMEDPRFVVLGTGEQAEATLFAVQADGTVGELLAGQAGQQACHRLEGGVTQGERRRELLGARE
jgi:hypothetical protein